MQLGDLPDKKEKQEDSNISSVSSSTNDILSEGIDTKPNQTNTANQTENILKPAGVVKDDTTPKNSVGSPKGRSKVTKIIFSILIILAILSFGIAVSMYLIKFVGNSRDNDVAQNNNSISRGFGSLVADTIPRSTTEGSLETDNVDEYNSYVISALDKGIKEYYEQNSLYPWDKYGDKPIPAMNKLMNSSNGPNYSWLESSGDFNNVADLNTLFENPTATAQLRVFGFASWYALCYKPTTDEYLSKANYDKFAEDVGEGQGEYLCVRSEIRPVQEN